MEFIKSALSFVLHINEHLGNIIQTYSHWTYLILFSIVFAETGLVITPFLPGDSLLFAAGLFAGAGKLNVFILFITLFTAACLGDSTNYFFGKYVGPRVFKNESSRLFNKKHLEKTNRFYEKHGAKTVIMARFVPIVRTFAPFVAGIGAMRYPTFLFYSIVGNLLWVTICVSAGYFLGNIPIISQNFEKAVLVIIAISVLPIGLEIWKERRHAKREATATESARANG